MPLQNLIGPDPLAPVVSLAQVRAALPPPPGQLSLAVLQHGSLLVKFYAPPGTDPQTPHDRDELYLVASGHATAQVGAQRYAVASGDVIFVPAREPHRFEDLSVDFAVWVMFYGPDGGEAGR
jgi:hypothetical protein